ncbi:MAG: hypothetical protein AT713_05000, partial [Caldivirga sp. JCHS_4]
MCRLIALSVNDVNLLRNALLKLREAARLDPMGPSGVVNHSDGWGLTLLKGNPKDGVLIQYRSTKPIYKDAGFETLVGALNGNDTYSGVAHVLNAEDKNVVSDLTVHPASAHVNDGELYVVHNGVVDKVKVYEHLRRRYGVALRVDQLNDTYILTQLIARVYDDLGTLDSVLGELAELTRVNGWLKSALNMGLMLVKPSQVEVYATTMYDESVLNNERRRKYYNLFVVKSSLGNLVASSTLVKSYGLGGEYV